MSTSKTHFKSEDCEGLSEMNEARRRLKAHLCSIFTSLSRTLSTSLPSYLRVSFALV